MSLLSFHRGGNRMVQDGERGLSSLDNRHCDSWESKRVSRTILKKDSWKQ